MATEKVWYSDANVAFPDFSTAALAAKSALWLWQSLMVGGSTGTNGGNGAPPVGSRWTCLGSSDSVTAALDGSNRWSATVFDGTKIVRANGAVAHSWIVLQSPAAMGPYYLIIDYNTAADVNIVVVGCKTAPTGGTITARPTSTDEWVHTTFVFNDGTATNQKGHRVTDADGNMYYFTSQVGVSPNRVQFCGAFQTLLDTQTADVYKAVTICDYNASTGADTTSCLNGFSNPGTDVFSGTNIIKGRTSNGSAAVNMAALQITLSPSAAPIWGSTGIQSSNPNSAKWDAFPMWCFIGTAGSRSIKGRFPDLLQASTAIGQGSVTPSSGTIERAFVGNCWTPLDVAPSF